MLTEIFILLSLVFLEAIAEYEELLRFFNTLSEITKSGKLDYPMFLYLYVKHITFSKFVCLS